MVNKGNISKYRPPRFASLFRRNIAPRLVPLGYSRYILTISATFAKGERGEKGDRKRDRTHLITEREREKET